MTLGEFIKNYRDEHSISMDKFSDMSGISKSYISLLEKNKHPKTGKPIAPSIKCIHQVADCCSIDFNSLFSLLDGDVSLSDEPAATDFTVTDFEKELLIAFRKADSIDKEMVLRVLGIREKSENIKIG